MNRSNALKPPKTAALPQASMELDEDSLGRYLGVSIALHLILLAALTLKAVFYPSESLQLERAIRVDIVGLPEKQAKLPPALKEEIKNEAKPEPKTEPKAEPVTPPKPEKVVLPDKTQPPPKPETNKINLQKTKQQQDSA
ncbi:MAG: hypothetical protein NDI61_09045, partial [Bdellovibrionaceae bacterium]|nr:hypothetical protein [Pseudobdellovibrionaceae bacterium]